MRSEHARPNESSVRCGGGLFLCLLLLISCGKVLGLKGGTVQGACTTDAQCAPGYGCLEQLGCRNRCTADSDCGVGSRCFKAFVTTACIPVSEGCGAADLDSGASDRCPQGTHCDGNVCRTQCDLAGQCAGGQECVAGACVGTDPSHEQSGGGGAGGGGLAGTSAGGASGASAMMGGGGGIAATGGAAPVDLCKGVTCQTPPDNDCNSGSEFESYDKVGSCADGVCSYVSHQIACTCENHSCTTDPCAAVKCTTPPAAVCKTAATATTYAATGTCSSGTCGYAPTDTGCGSNKQCSGAGVCSECKADSSCGATCAACGGGTPKCKDLGTTSQCVACVSNADCSGATPICNTGTNVCGPQFSSCAGLAATCGPSGNASCCASSVVTGGTFNRGNDANYPATVSDFRLDTYEITVGRFRNFWNGYPANVPAAGSGKNPNNSSDPGWDAAWNAGALPASQAQLTTNISCGAGYQTWTAGNDALPMNCIDWFDAEAFCIWDGGRLPTEAEWNYAAVGGTQQRVYPWGSAAPDCTYANFEGATGFCVAPPNGADNRVGSESPKGDGLYGQADLAGNEWEWVQDSEVIPYTNPCNNCSNLTVSSFRVVRGGGFDGPASNLLSSYRLFANPSTNGFGGRCARTR